MAYAEVDDVREMTNLEVADIGDDDVESILDRATSKISRHINVGVTRERVEFLDQTRENKIDGSNKEYYVKNWKGKYIGDRNGDGEIDEDDVEVYLVDSNGNETEATVSSVDSSTSKITLNSAPDSSDTVYITYSWTTVDPETPDEALKLACIYLTAAFCYAKINVGRPTQIQIGSGNVKLYRHMKSFDHYYRLFEKEIGRVNSKSLSSNKQSVHSF